MIYLTRYPERAKSDPSGQRLSCTWNCSRQPLVFEFERRDCQVLSIHTSGFGGKSIIVLNASAPDILAGTRVFFKNNVTSFNALVKTVNVYPTQTILSTDQPFNGNLTGGFLNSLSRANYYIGLNVNLTDPISGNITINSTKFYPDPKGSAKCDVQAFVNDFMQKVFTFDYTSQNKKDTSVYAKFTVDFFESYTGIPVIIPLVDPRIYYVADAAKYLLEGYGQNLADFITYLYDVQVKAKFLTTFERPTYFAGYPFSLGFIYPSELEPATVTIQEIRYDRNLSSLGTGSANIDSSQTGAVNQLCLVGSNQANTAFIDVWLKVGGVAQRGYVNSGYVAPGYAELQPPTIDTAVYDITEHKQIKVVMPCGSNEIFVRWRNRLGSWDYWLFQRNQYVEDKVKIDGVYSNEPLYIDEQNYRSAITRATTVEQITLGAVVTTEDFQGIKGIESSPCVEILWDKSTNEFMRVQIVPRGFKRETRASRTEIEVTIELPEYYNIPN